MQSTPRTMNAIAAAAVAAAAVVASAGLGGCAREHTADLGAIYDLAAHETAESRPPVVVLPGILGTKLEQGEGGRKVWGAFVRGAVDVDKPDGARIFALPMAEGVPLSELTDDVVPTEVLDRVTVDIGILTNLKIGAYVHILKTLAVGKYRDSMLGDAGAIDYGGLHYTCFQFGYDWRRDVAEQAAFLDQEIDAARVKALTARGLDPATPMRVDVVAHSMGGMVLRYYLRYGAAPLPESGAVPPPTWAGAEKVGQAILIGTPSAGSALALQQLVRGMNLNPIFPNYRPGIVGTLPAIYQLLPRARHQRVTDADGTPIDVLDPAVWERYGWGLADPDQARSIAWLLPDVDSAADRRRIALDHLAKCLRQAERLHEALDRPSIPPPHLRLSLFAGDSEDTVSAFRVRDDGTLERTESAAGDGTVTRASALMDERLDGNRTPKLRTPVAWDRVQFLFEDHLGLTRSAAFTDNLLYLLLEDPAG